MERPRDHSVSQGFSDIRRLVSSSALYAAGLVQRGVGFLLIPFYTRVSDPIEYGMLEILSAFSSVFFAGAAARPRLPDQ